MMTFRFVTLNVYSFRNPQNYESNISDLISILKPLDLDLIGVQEIENNGKWKKFCSRLSFQHSIFGECENDFLGNGIASRYPIQYYSNQKTLSYQGGIRSLLQCRLDGFEKLSLAVTHLDHIDENNRLAQINEFNLDKQNIDILMGDMNSLTREDYSDNYYRDIIVRQREKSQWEKPRFDLTNIITNQLKYKDVFKVYNPQLKDEELVTCQYGTRIDYIYIHPRVFNQWTLKKCEIIDTNNATDHNAIFVELELNSK